MTGIGLEDYLQLNPALHDQWRRLSPKSYAEFIDLLHQDLDQLVGMLEADAKDLGDAGEDVISRNLVRLLKARFYVAGHDTDEGGHVDIHVRSPNGSYSWLAEAKLDNGPAYVGSGLKQLTERYARGTAGHNVGAVLIYFQKKRCAERFAEWRTYLDQTLRGDYEDLTIEDCPIKPGLAFHSEYVLPRIGAGAPKYRVRHIAVSLFREGVT